MKHKIEFIYREARKQVDDRYLGRKLRTCPFPLLNSLVRLSWDDDQSGPVQVEIGAMCAEALTFAFHKDVQLSIDGKPASLTNVRDMDTFPEWASISRRLAEGVFVVGDSIYVDVEEAVDEYLSRCKRAGKWDVRLPDGTLLPLA